MNNQNETKKKLNKFIILFGLLLFIEIVIYRISVYGIYRTTYDFLFIFIIFIASLIIITHIEKKYRDKITTKKVKIFGWILAGVVIVFFIYSVGYSIYDSKTNSCEPEFKGGEMIDPCPEGKHCILFQGCIGACPTGRCRDSAGKGDYCHYGIPCKEGLECVGRDTGELGGGALMYRCESSSI